MDSSAIDQDYVAKAQVISDHFALDESQLDLRVGDFVYILEKDGSGWWGGHKEGQETTGWFPYTVVRCIDEPVVPVHQTSAPHDAEVVVQQNTTSSSAGVFLTESHQDDACLAHGYQSSTVTKMPAPKLDIQDSRNPQPLQTQVESPTRKARWPASPMMPQGQHSLRETVARPEAVQSSPSRERELMELKDTLKKERTKHMEELTVERGRRESLEANKQQHSAQIARMQEAQENLRKQSLKLEKENTDLRTRLHSLETAQPQQNEAEQVRRLQEQVSLCSRQAEKIWHAVEKNVSPAMLMKIKADAPEEPEPIPQPNLGNGTVEVARRLFSGGVESSPATRARAESAFAVSAHASDSWAKPPTVPKSGPLPSRPAVSSREGTPVKLTRPFSCTDLEPEEAPAKGAVATMVKKLERCCSTPPQRNSPARNYEPQGNPAARGRSPANSERALAWQPLQLDGTKNFGLNRDGFDNDEPVNFGMSPISTARAQEAFTNNKGNDAGTVRSATPSSGIASCSSLVRNRIRQLETGV